MQKEQYILKGNDGESYPEFTLRILSVARALTKDFKPDSLKITLTTRRPPLISVIPFKKGKAAVISVVGAKPGMPGKLSEMEGFAGGYRVNEAIPVAYEKNWDDQAPTPGACLLTLFHKKPGIDRELFLKRWHEGHTPLSLRLHPLWNYNRNVVEESLWDGSERYDGIVEEQFRIAKELLNPLVFFGPPARVPGHMMEVYRDTRSFIDMKRIETYLATEYHIKS